MSDKETGASAGGLLNTLAEKFGWKPKEKAEASLAGVRAPAVAPSTEENADWSKITGVQPVGWESTKTPDSASTPEPTPTMMPQPTETETPAPAAEDELPEWLRAPEGEVPPEGKVSAEDNELSDWLRGWNTPEPVLAPLPEPEASPVVEMSAVAVEAPVPAPIPDKAATGVLGYLEKQEAKLAAEKRSFPAPEVPAPLPAAETPTVEAPAPMAAAEVKVEDDPFAINREFNGYMEIIRNAQAVLATGIELDYKDQKKALIAVAKSNSLLPKLPSEVFKSVLLMRAVASGNPKFGRDDFQREMLAAMDVIKGKK